jgi:hypothetical protein
VKKDSGAAFGRGNRAAALTGHDLVVHLVVHVTCVGRVPVDITPHGLPDLMPDRGDRSCALNMKNQSFGSFDPVLPLRLRAMSR